MRRACAAIATQLACALRGVLRETVRSSPRRGRSRRASATTKAAPSSALTVPLRVDRELEIVSRFDEDAAAGRARARRRAAARRDALDRAASGSRGARAGAAALAASLSGSSPSPIRSWSRRRRSRRCAAGCGARGPAARRGRRAWRGSRRCRRGSRACGRPLRRAREHQDRHGAGARVGAQPLADLEAVHLRHHHVEQDQIGRIGRAPPPGPPDRWSPSRRRSGMPLRCRNMRHQVAEIALVIDHQGAVAARQVGAGGNGRRRGLGCSCVGRSMPAGVARSVLPDVLVGGVAADNRAPWTRR